jgi:hypothetical protein
MLASAIALIGLATLVPAASAQSACSLATLKGNYGVSQSGWETKNPKAPLEPFAIVGTVAFDGAGNFSTTATAVQPMPGPQNFIPQTIEASGTYTVNSDCTGSLTFTGPGVLTANLVIIGGGTEVFGIVTLPFVVATIDIKKQ